MTTITYTTFDIVGFIEKNPLSRLDFEYQNALINKIKSVFNEEEQQLFVTSFYCYLNYNPTTDFVIDFEDAWKWCGFTRKDNAKRILEKYFIENIDYKVETITPPIGGVIKERGGAHRKEKITLNIRTFKKYCLKSDTEKSNEIHNYYIKLEEILHETLLEQTDELRLQLENKENDLNLKDNKIEELRIQNKSLSKYVVKKFGSRYNIGNCVYLITSSEIKGKFKVGVTKNVNVRLSSLSTGSPYYFEILGLFYTEFHFLLEQTIKEIFGKNRISVSCEWYELDSIVKMKEFISNTIQTYDDFKINSNIHILDELEENNTLSIKDNNKACLECNQIFSLKFFFCVDKNNKIFDDKCISCYEKDHGDSKQCRKCSKIKRKIEFVVDRSKEDGLKYECKDCKYERNNKKKEEVKLLYPNLGKIQCETCSFFKDVKMFYKTTENGIREYCKQCYCDKYGKSKQCFTCKEIKLESEFSKKSASTDGLECYCKTCRKQSRDDEKVKKNNNNIICK